MPSQPLRFGVLGAAKIARAFGCAPSTDVRVVAVASRGLEKAEALAAETGIPRAHGSYEGLLADPEIDAVYLPTQCAARVLGDRGCRCRQTHPL